MPGKNESPDTKGNLILQRELFDGQLESQYDDEMLRTTFAALEGAVAAATREEPLTLYEGFKSLAEYSEKARLQATTVGATATSAFFTEKHKTFVSFLEPLAELPHNTPKQTDTHHRDMSRNKR